jgi:signal transduction histidine kinase
MPDETNLTVGTSEPGSHIYAFRPKARTVDHLGREQIADSPTAVTELWKNSFDAYARSVSLHVFDGERPSAAVLDDGSGMSTAEYIDRWLVLGTETKLEQEKDDDRAVEDRDGLPVRVRQGQKGIGRLSVAFLGPVVLVLTKKKKGPFTASLVDWRLFENPYLLLSDVGIPVREFFGLDEFPKIFSELLDDSMDNVWGKKGSPDRNKRIATSWEQLSATEFAEGQSESTADRIASSLLSAEVPTRGLAQWSVWGGTDTHGTAMFIFDIRDELRAWVDPERQFHDDEASRLRDEMKRTLAGFSDPFSPQNIAFDYSMVIHKRELQEVAVSSKSQLGMSELRTMEHFIEGRFDEKGVFYGRARAFNKDFGEFTMTPTHPIRTTRLELVGPFELCVGTFEIERTSSTHSEEIHQALSAQLETMAGLRIYRDGLRVLPYGRPDFDFFGIEERRSKHAGREFWNHRRMFGRVAITKEANGNLRDKAGREGLIENAASRELRNLLVMLLEFTARKFFGTDAEHRKLFVDEINAFNKAAAAADKQAARGRLRMLNNHLTNQSTNLDNALKEIGLLELELERARESDDIDAVLALAPRIEKSKQLRSDFRPPPRPAKLGRAEAAYRSFRDRYNMYLAAVDSASTRWSDAAEKSGKRNPIAVAKSTFGRHQKFLTDDINRRMAEIRALFASELARLEKVSYEDRSHFYKLAAPLLADLEAGKSELRAVLASFEQIREIQHQSTARFYAGYLSALQQLAADIDLDAAVSWSSEQRGALEERVEQLTALAQLGVTVEIIGHELESLDAEVGRNLRRLPQETRDSDAYRLALTAQQSLVNRLRFLAPLRLSGPQLKEVITGDSLSRYLACFFEGVFASESIHFHASDAFKKMRLTDYSHRIYPVFINLINNAVYWIKQVDDRRINLDVIGNTVCVADSGPGVDPDDQQHLFELFFSRRVEGRGVGLYLCRANLAASGHTISFQNGGPCLTGANFLLHFRGN